VTEHSPLYLLLEYKYLSDWSLVGNLRSKKDDKILQGEIGDITERKKEDLVPTVVS
jgi:hypothetical protein